jgi:hypothetical protein
MKSVKQGKSQGAVTACKSVFLHRINVLTVNLAFAWASAQSSVLGLSLLREALASLPQDCHKDTARCD